MSVTTFQMKTHSRKDVTDQFPKLPPCKIHGCQPMIQEVVAGKRKETHYIALCSGSSDCNKISMESAAAVVGFWNKFNEV